MNVLAFDTAVTGCSACLFDGLKSHVKQMETERGQAEFLVPLIDRLLKDASFTYAQIDRIAVTVGPGSFTGVRIGLSTAKALALSLDKPLLGFTTLEVIARKAEFKKVTLVLIDTKRGDFYGQVFDEKGKSVTEAKIWSEEEIQASGYEALRDAIPDPITLTKMASEAEVTKNAYNPATAPTPLYLRGAEVSQSKRIAPTIVSG